jgi:lipopolysaccharide/colanic/teichoic acid biosynthesis glycosyltransferase
MNKLKGEPKGRGIIRLLDIFLALVLMPFAITLFILLLFPQLVCFGAVFYVSTRTGQGGRNFRYAKLRSMRDVSAETHGRAHLETGRIPAWGHFIRKIHLDEIPELFYILAGMESFVGPRPLLPEHAALADSPERRAVKTGWTGFSQIFLKTRGILPSRIQRRLDSKLGRELCPSLYIKLLCATFCASGRRPLKPGPTVLAYRQSIQEKA